MMIESVGQKDKQRRIAHVIQIIEVSIRMEFGGKSFFLVTFMSKIILYYLI